ncbi:MAG: hypothetical protein HQM04_16680 [Magnetococcales bacterium]|nr:hypothetical protein [Magnetococcales bacterium]MBF0116666.1 hypothetical protein [Magnetococcales bacterium]
MTPFDVIVPYCKATKKTKYMANFDGYFTRRITGSYTASGVTYDHSVWIGDVEYKSYRQILTETITYEVSVELSEADQAELEDLYEEYPDLLVTLNDFVHVLPDGSDDKSGPFDGRKLLDGSYRYKTVRTDQSHQDYGDSPQGWTPNGYENVSYPHFVNSVVASVYVYLP